MMLGRLWRLPIITVAMCHLVAAQLETFTDDIKEHEWGAPPPGKRKISEDNNSLFIGEKKEHDKVIFKTEVDIRGSPGKVTEHTVQFPEEGKTNTKKINFISIIDFDIWEEGGTPVITSGGVNYTHATIHLKSQPGKHLDFQIVIRGREPF